MPYQSLFAHSHAMVFRHIKIPISQAVRDGAQCTTIFSVASLCVWLVDGISPILRGKGPVEEGFWKNDREKRMIKNERSLTHSDAMHISKRTSRDYGQPQGMRETAQGFTGGVWAKSQVRCVTHFQINYTAMARTCNDMSHDSVTRALNKHGWVSMERRSYSYRTRIFIMSLSPCVCLLEHFTLCGKLGNFWTATGDDS